MSLEKLLFFHPYMYGQESGRESDLEQSYILQHLSGVDMQQHEAAIIDWSNAFTTHFGMWICRQSCQQQ